MKYLLSILLVTILASCSSMTSRNTYKLTPEMSEDEVRQVMGEPESAAHGTWLYFVSVDGWGNTVPYFIKFREGKVASYGPDKTSVENYLRHQNIGDGMTEMAQGIKSLQPEPTYVLQPTPSMWR